MGIRDRRASLKLDAEAPGRSQTVRASYDGRDYEVSRGAMTGGGAVVRPIWHQHVRYLLPPLLRQPGP